MILRIIFLSLLLTAASCSSATKIYSERDKGFVEEVVVETNCPTKPDWVYETPEEDESYMYFVGRSRRFSTEQDAIGDAKVDATNRFVAYCGVSVSIMDDYLEITSQKSSEVIDPFVQGEARQSMRATAFVSRLKDKRMCVEKYAMMRDGGVLRHEYGVYLLVKIPRDEYDRVRSFASEERRQREEESSRASELIKGRVEEMVEAADRFVGRGDVISALASLGSAKSMMAEVPGPGPSPAVAALEVKEGAMLGRIRLERGAGRAQAVEPGSRIETIKARVVYEGEGGRMPVAGVRVAFYRDGNRAGSAYTDKDGVAGWTPDPVREKGTIRLTAGLDTKDLAYSLSPDAVRSLESRLVDFEIVVRDKTIEEKARDLVTGLEAGIEGAPSEMSVVLGNFTYGESEQAGVFSRRFTALLENELTGSGNLKLIKRANSDGKSETKRHGHGGQSGLPSGADAVLYGNYFEQGSEVKILARLDDVSGRPLSTAGISMPAERVPEGWSLTAGNFQHVAGLTEYLDTTKTDDDFALELWTERGEAVYQAGNRIYVNVRSPVDCYLRLVYVDASGNNILIFPNRFYGYNKIKAGRIYTIPADGSGFEFKVVPPFGAEMLIAFASTQQFPELDGTPASEVTVLNGNTRSIIGKLRGVEVVGSKPKRAEKRVIITTVP